MQELFGSAIEMSVRRPASSTHLGRDISYVQLALPFPTFSAPVGEEKLGGDGKPIRPPLRDAVEQHLRDSGLAYVDVAKGQTSFFKAKDLRPFDFAVYGPDQPIWLILADDTSDAARQDLQKWERILGPEFQGLIAVREYDDDSVSFETLDGERIQVVVPLGIRSPYL